MNSKFVTGAVIAAGLALAGCASVQGTVFKQTDGNYKGSYSARTERDALKVVHDDAKTTCKKDEKTEKFAVVDQKVESLTQKTEGAKDGFAAVAGSAVTVVDKIYGSENVRATLVFTCEK